jgi:hypothetical protein
MRTVLEYSRCGKVGEAEKAIRKTGSGQEACGVREEGVPCSDPWELKGHFWGRRACEPTQIFQDPMTLSGERMEMRQGRA